ncbi:MAG: VWA domain-containing protein [Acidobacteriota bacterium]|nr:VWA domain-containing protein [Acidobacteriota bacterium]
MALQKRPALNCARTVFVLLFICAGAVFSQEPTKPGAPDAVPQSSAPAAPRSQSPPVAPANEPPIRVTTGVVHLVVTVVDKHHHLVTDLNRDDFKILENGVPQDIRFFGRETDLPLRIAVLLDTSNSIRPRLGFEKEAAVNFLNDVIRRAKDMAFLMTFDNEPDVIQDYTDQLYLLTAAIQDQRAGGGTALNDAIYMAAQKLEKAPLMHGQASDLRRVIVVISDGDDDLSDHAFSDAIEEAIRSEAVIYTISTNNDWVSIDNPDKPNKYNMDPGDKVLKDLAEQTGGRAFFPYSTDDLAESFTNIGTELRSQYFIAYSPTNPPVSGEYRKIEVRTNQKGLIVRARRGYYAASPAGNTSGN